MRSPENPALDCSRPGIALFWFIMGVLIALVPLNAYAGGNWGRLLRVGLDNPMRGHIERDLGPVAGPDRTGHDGQMYYLIARDPLARREVADAIAAFDDNGARYRYRRILFPALAGGFGQFSGAATLLSMIGWLLVGYGVATVAVADLAFHLRTGGAAVLAAAVNPGAIVSLLILTADGLALGLALGALALTVRGRFKPALVLLAAAALTKEAYLVVAFAAAAWFWQQRRRPMAVAFAVAPAAPLAAWNAWLLVAIEEPSAAMRNLGLPFEGLAQAPGIWIRYERNAVEVFLIAFIAAALAAAVIGLIAGRNHLLRWTSASWLALATVTAVPVWEKPNNAARTFAMLWPLAVLLVAQRRANDHRPVRGD